MDGNAGSTPALGVRQVKDSINSKDCIMSSKQAKRHEQERHDKYFADPGNYEDDDIEYCKKEIEGFPGYYVTRFGNVFSDRKRIPNQLQGMIKLKPVTNFEGYLIVSLYRNGKRSQGKIHRLIANAFLPNPDNLPVVRHLNDDKQKNNVGNLAWGNPVDNSGDMVEHGRSLKGEKNPSAKLTASEVKLIRIMASEGKGPKFLAGLFGVSDGHICNITAGRCWIHV